MKKINSLIFLSIVLLSTFTLTSALVESDNVASSQPVGQLLNSKIQNSLSNNTPVFIYFYSDLCHYCKEQSPIIDELEKEYMGNITVIRINKDINPLKAKEFNVTSIPAMFLTIRLNKSAYGYQEFIGLENYSTLSESFDNAISMEAKAQTEQDPPTGPDPRQENNKSTTYVLTFTLLTLLALAGVIIYLLKK